MKIGIIGLPNAGKSTIFNALSHGSAKVEKYPFTTIEPNIGVVNVPDHRLTDVANIYKPAKVVSTTINFLDVAGLVKGASHGEGLGNQFLSNIRETDAIVHVVRCFHDDEVPHNYGNVDPPRDIEIINTELILADLEIVERNVKVKEKTRLNDKEVQHEYDVLLKLQKVLEQGKLLNTIELTEEEKKIVKGYGLLTSKPVVYVANVDESSLCVQGLDEENINKNVKVLPENEVIKICGKWESELLGLDSDTQKEFMKDAEVSELGLHKLIKVGYKMLGFITFFSTESAEVKAWTIKKGTKIPQAAGCIHTDMEKGFIKAEVVQYDSLMKWKDPHKVKEHGELKIEGKEYIVKDGDIVKIHFSS